MYRIFGIAFKKSSPNPRSSTFPPTLPARSFIVSPFAFRSAVHLVRWVRPVLRCVSLRADTQSLQHRLWKRLSCFVELLLCQRSVGSLYVGLYSRLSVPFRRSVCLFCWYHTDLIAVAVYEGLPVLPLRSSSISYWLFCFIIFS